MTMSSALRWPVSSPWKLRHERTPTAYLSSQQRVVLLYLSRSTKRGRRTLEEMTKTLGMTSRGQLSRELRRLRQLELIGYSTRLGAHGSHRLWLTRAAARMRAIRHARARGNDSTSTTFGGFLSLDGLRKAELARRRPPARAGAAARDGPRRGRRPPNVVLARCPLGHPTRLGRRSSEVAPSGQLVRAVFTGICRRCGDRPVSEIFEMAVVAPPPRPLSAAELADPALLEARIRQAALFAQEGHRVDQRTIRFYTAKGAANDETADPSDRDHDQHPAGRGPATLRDLVEGAPKVRPERPTDRG